jgi:L-seryl-tRNA(Ser) seleniumtransferase
LRALHRPLAEIRTMAKRLQPIFAARLDGAAAVDIVACDSEIGSGALATQQVASAGLAIRPATGRRGAGTALKNLAQAFRSLPVPVIGRIEGGAFLLDLRCLDDETTLAAQLPQLAWPDKPAP